MDKHINYQLRPDANFIKLNKKRNNQAIYLLKHPDSGEIFEFGEEEYYLCKKIVRGWEISEIIASFDRDFDQHIDKKFIINFHEKLISLNLLEECPSNPCINYLLEPEQIQSTYDTLLGNIAGENPSFIEDNILPEIFPKKSNKTKNKPDKIVLFNPTFLFKILTAIAPPPIIIISLFILVLIVGCKIFISHQFIFWKDLYSFAKPIFILKKVCFSLIFINFLGQILRGTVYSYYGGIIKELGLKLALGVVPVFYMSLPTNKEFTRSEKLWIFSSILLFRLSMINLGILIWFIFRQSQLEISTFGLALSQAGLLGLLINGNLFWRSSAYLWLTTYLRDPNLLERSFFVLQSKFTPTYLPGNLSEINRIKLKLYAITYAIGLILISGGLFYFSLVFLVTNFKLTGLIIFLIVLLLVWRWYCKMKLPKNYNHRTFPNPEINEAMQKKTSEDFWKKITIFFKANYLKLGFVLILLIVLPLPHKYRPAGSIKILSTQQKEIQADISGKITKINVEGGDGSWVKARTPIAEIEPSRQLNDSTPVYNDRLVKLEEINYQKALQQKAEAKLQQLLSTPRPEAVAVAQKELELAKQELEAARSKQSTAENELIVAQSQLQTGIVQLDFRERAAARLKELNQQGAIALQDYEDAEKLAETGRAEVEVQKNNVATKQRNIEEEKRNVESKIKDVELKTAYLSLVMSGPHPDEIMAARQDIEAISVEIKRLNQQLNYTTDQLKGHRLLMPFDGHITTPFLYQKVGTYIQQGQTFAVAEDDRTVLAEIEIPESDAEEFSLGAKTEIKLMAYPNTTIVGKVLNIEPTTKEEENGNFIRVRVEIPNPKRLLKSGMSGYAKIEGSVKPLFWVISRPLVRFIKVEVWSWIP